MLFLDYSHHAVGTRFKVYGVFIELRMKITCKKPREVRFVISVLDK